jgi:hypothetical protein
MKTHAQKSVAVPAADFFLVASVFPYFRVIELVDKFYLSEKLVPLSINNQKTINYDDPF